MNTDECAECGALPGGHRNDCANGGGDDAVLRSLRRLSRAVLEIMEADGLRLDTPTGSYARCVLLKSGFDAIGWPTPTLATK